MAGPPRYLLLKITLNHISTKKYGFWVVGFTLKPSPNNLISDFQLSGSIVGTPRAVGWWIWDHSLVTAPLGRFIQRLNTREG